MRTWQPIEVSGSVRLVAGRTGHGADPIVAIHGLTTDHRSFDGVADFLQHRGGLLALDLRGRGGSDKPLLGYGLEQHARDVIRMMDQQGIDRATIVGHSMGGYVALVTALMFPDRVGGIVLLDSGWPRPAFPVLAPNSPTLLAGIGGTLLRVATRSPLEFNAVHQDSWLVAAAAPTAAQLRALRCPVTLVRATDGFVQGTPPVIDSATAREIRECLPLKDDIVLLGANHLSLLTDRRFARHVAAAIDRFQRQISGHGIAGEAGSSGLV